LSNIGVLYRAHHHKKVLCYKNVLNAEKLDALFAIGSHIHRVLSTGFDHPGEKLLK
jgi:hypothetical protein